MERRKLIRDEIRQKRSRNGGREERSEIRNESLMSDQTSEIRHRVSSDQTSDLRHRTAVTRDTVIQIPRREVTGGNAPVAGTGEAVCCVDIVIM